MIQIEYRVVECNQHLSKILAELGKDTFMFVALVPACTDAAGTFPPRMIFAKVAGGSLGAIVPPFGPAAR
jgi:hypothetical protein